MDLIHIQVALSLGSTHFFTTDRCLSRVRTNMVMELIRLKESQGSDIIWPAPYDRETTAMDVADGWDGFPAQT